MLRKEDNLVCIGVLYMYPSILVGDNGQNFGIILIEYERILPRIVCSI